MKLPPNAKTRTASVLPARSRRMKMRSVLRSFAIGSPRRRMKISIRNLRIERPRESAGAKNEGNAGDGSARKTKHSTFRAG
jgi:hypothetical protein